MKNLKKMILTFFIICLLTTSGFGFATGENETLSGENKSESFSSEEIESNIKNETERVGEKVKTPSGGSKNISFTDGYNGYCINKGWKGAKENDEFIVSNTSMAKNSINKADISNYLKILFVDYHDFAVKNADETAKIVWNFTDRQYWKSTNEIIQGILNIAESGRVIADHGEVKKINNTTEALFNFEVLDSVKSGHQNFFGYKITYRTIPITEENETDITNTTTNETNTTNTTANETDITNTTTNETNTTNTTVNETDTTNETNMTENETRVLGVSLIKNRTESNPDYEITDDDNLTQNVDVKKSNEPSYSAGLSKHKTGNIATMFLVTLMVICGILIIKNRRD